MSLWLKHISEVNTEVYQLYCILVDNLSVSSNITKFPL